MANRQPDQQHQPERAHRYESTVTANVNAILALRAFFAPLLERSVLFGIDERVEGDQTTVALYIMSRGTDPQPFRIACVEKFMDGLVLDTERCYALVLTVLNFSIFHEPQRNAWMTRILLNRSLWRAPESQIMRDFPGAAGLKAIFDSLRNTAQFTEAEVHQHALYWAQNDAIYQGVIEQVAREAMRFAEEPRERSTLH